MLFAYVKLLTFYNQHFWKLSDTHGFHLYQEAFIWYKLIVAKLLRLIKYLLVSSDNAGVRKLFRLF